MAILIIETKNKDFNFLEIAFDSEDKSKEVEEELIKQLNDYRSKDSTKYTPDTKELFQEEITEPSKPLKKFINDIIINKSTPTPFKCEDIISEELIFYHHIPEKNTYYLCIQKNKTKNFKQQQKRIIIWSKGKFTSIKTENILNINNYFDAVIEIHHPNSESILPKVYFYNTPKKYLLCDIRTLLKDRNPYKYDSKEAIITALKSNKPFFNRFIDFDSLEHVVVDKNTKTKINEFIHYKEDEFEQIIDYLITSCKEKKYITQNTSGKSILFFPENKGEFKEFLKIISQKAHLWRKHI